ncbi:MAG: hypothetical protein HY815_06860 [Candidatus Riflebacteria bacterium]|nr:hypothetical protein [Candidatus Riflebacteria bacterium]
MRPWSSILVLMLVAAVWMTGCGSGEEESLPPGCTPLKELVASGRSPIQVSSARVWPNPLMKQFKVSLMNVCDKRIKTVEWTTLLYDEAGKLLPDGQRPGIFNELIGVKPGESWEGVMVVGDATVTGKIVLKSVVYESAPRGAEGKKALSQFKMMFRWKNPKHDADVAAAGGKVAPPSPRPGASPAGSAAPIASPTLVPSAKASPAPASSAR